MAADTRMYRNDEKNEVTPANRKQYRSMRGSNLVEFGMRQLSYSLRMYEHNNSTGLRNWNFVRIVRE